MDTTKRYRFSLNISPDTYSAYYAGAVKSVVVQTDAGKTVQFPAAILRQFLAHDGIHGVFEMEIDQNNKLVNFRRLEQKRPEDGIWL